ncbi:acyl-CoA thioesterase [Jatrophihabitans sp. YIM 134969]
MPTATWSAPVRFVEVDAQEVVFNAHYLTWCDEAMAAYFAALPAAGRDLVEFTRNVRLVTTTLTWRSSVAWRETVAVDVTCTRIGRSSLTLSFTIRVGERVCCEVETVYVSVGSDGTPVPVPDDIRSALTASDD